MKTLITALGLAFTFATVAPAIGTLPFAATAALAHDKSDSKDRTGLDKNNHDKNDHDKSGHDKNDHDKNDR